MTRHPSTSPCLAVPMTTHHSTPYGGGEPRRRAAPPPTPQGRGATPDDETSHPHHKGKGDKTLLNAMYNPTSMDSIIESNHTCGAYTYNIINLKTINKRRRSEREAFNINNMNVSIQQKIRRKVVLALCGFEGELFDLSHLNDLPLQLMPRVLELIQEHTEARTREVKRTRFESEKQLTFLFSFLTV